MTPKRFFRGILALIFTFAVVYMAEINGSTEVQRWLVTDFVRRTLQNAPENQVSEMASAIIDALKSEGYGVTDDRNRFLSEQQIKEIDGAVQEVSDVNFRPLMDENDLMEIIKAKAIPEYFWDYTTKTKQ